jgi:hypothetical protein
MKITKQFYHQHIEINIYTFLQIFEVYDIQRLILNK